MSCAKIDPALHQAQKPPWIKVRLPSNPVFFLDQGAHFRSAPAHRLRERAMPESLGMLEPGHGDDDDRGRSLHARLRILRGDNGEAIRARRRRTATRRRSRAADGVEARRHHRGRARRSEGRRRRIILRARSKPFATMDPSIIIEVLVPGFSRAGLVHPDRRSTPRPTFSITTWRPSNG